MVKLLNPIMRQAQIITHDGRCVLQVYELHVGVFLHPFILAGSILALMIPLKPCRLLLLSLEKKN